MVVHSLLTKGKIQGVCIMGLWKSMDGSDAVVHHLSCGYQDQRNNKHEQAPLRGYQLQSQDMRSDQDSWKFWILC